MCFKERHAIRLAAAKRWDIQNKVYFTLRVIQLLGNVQDLQ